MRACSFDEFVAALYESGVLPPADIQSFFDAIPEEQCPSTSDDLAAEMVRRGMLTTFQATALLGGKTRGLVLGNYVILDRLGKGGMGRLFRSLHTRMRRIVALKVLPPSSMTSQKSVERFQREVEAMARLSHPNIVTAFDAGEDKGVRFLAMEYVEGSNLASLLAHRGTLAAATAVEYILQAARGLEYAHWHGMVHRDVKPENLILDWRGTIKVLDLGIVGLVDGLSGPGADHETAASRERAAVYGTPDYMAPEQLAGSATVGPTCDIYSLGCTLHFLLVGKPVFGGPTAEAKLQAHRKRPVPSIRASRPDVPKPLDDLFRRMLAKRPEDRPETMGEVIAELERCLQLVPAAAEPASAGADEVLDDPPDPPDCLTDQFDTVPIEVAGQGTPNVAGSWPRPRAGKTAARRRAVGWFLVGLFGVGALGGGLLLGHWWKEVHRGSLVIDVHEPGAAVQVVDDAGDVVLDFPSAKGRLKFALPAGTYRLSVRRGERDDPTEPFEVIARQPTVIQIPMGSPPRSESFPSREAKR